MRTLVLKRADIFWFPKARSPWVGARPSPGRHGRFTAAATRPSWGIPTMNPVVRSAAVPAEFPEARRAIRLGVRALDAGACAPGQLSVPACLFGPYPNLTLTCGYSIRH